MSNNNRFFAGVDIGATKILTIIYNSDFKVMGRARKKTKAHEGPSAVLSRVHRTLSDALEDAGLQPRRLKGIGVGCPGPVDPETGIVHQAPNLGWEKLPLKRSLENRFKCPAYILNDVDAGMYGEFRFGAAKKARCAIGIFPGTGIGGACVYKGELITGADISCFEIGHIQVQPKGPLCGCGQRGCLEAVASRLAISSAAAAAAYRGEAPHLLELGGLDLSNYGSGVLAEAIKRGDAGIERIVRMAAGWLGVGVAAVVHLMMPEIVVIGGGLAEAMPRLFLEETTKSARDRVLPAYRKRFRIVISKLGDDAATLGAAAWAEHCLSIRSKRKK